MSRKSAGKNRTKFKIKGLNQEKFINKLIKNVSIYNFCRKKHNESEFETDLSKEKIVVKMASESGIEIEIISQSGFVTKLKRLFASYGIIVALAVSVAFYFVQYNYIWKIEIYGENKVEERLIKEFVNENLPSRIKNKIKTKEMEQLIKENFKEISSVSVAIVGQSLILNLNESILPEEMEGDYKPMLSEFDGLVTEISLIQGTLAVKVGDIVQKGDTLVYPYVIDSQGEVRPVEPKAEIHADIWLTQKYMHYDYQIIERRTGEKAVISEVYLNKLLIYSQNSKHNFSQFEVEQEEIPLTYNLLLPLSLKKTVYYETETIEIKQEFCEAKDEIIASVREKALIFLEENEIIINENYTLREEGGCHEICYVITVNRNIGG